MASIIITVIIIITIIIIITTISARLTSQYSVVATGDAQSPLEYLRELL